MAARCGPAATAARAGCRSRRRRTGSRSTPLPAADSKPGLHPSPREVPMSLPNSPDPALREAVVRQDLGNVLHPIVQHRQLETRQMVIAGGSGSTVVDADGTEYLDAMAGLWCVNIGY